MMTMRLHMRFRSYVPNLALNTTNTMEIMFQDETARHTLVYIKTKVMERAPSFNVMAVTITEDFSKAGSCE